MQNPLQVTFRDISHSENIHAMCEEEVEKLEQVCPDPDSRMGFLDFQVLISSPYSHGL